MAAGEFSDGRARVGGSDAPGPLAGLLALADFLAANLQAEIKRLNDENRRLLEKEVIEGQLGVAAPNAGVADRMQDRREGARNDRD